MRSDQLDCSVTADNDCPRDFWRNDALPIGFPDVDVLDSVSRALENSAQLATLRFSAKSIRIMDQGNFHIRGRKLREMSSPLQFVSLGRARRGRRTQRGWNYHKDTENTEFKFKKIEEFGVSGGLHEIWSQRGDRFQCNGTPGTVFKSEKERFSLSGSVRDRSVLRIYNKQF
jgi:hypothetical protein